MPDKEQELVRKFEELVLTLPAHELTEMLECSYSMLHRLKAQIRHNHHKRAAISYKGVITLLSRYLL
ncbi:hypothetical protein ABEV13_10675 [Geobacillus stearothermophilus]|uniref:hypothetical protein n=1 Tax=Geobacillus TaxID=129337 RepID=UPI000FFB9B54|nr:MULTISPECIES: hypothetical protein [Geobacillus]MED3721620.1 hypothetical protein [Geobacillus stearothermophilus]